MILDYYDARILKANETTDTIVFSSAFPSASYRRRSLPDHDLWPPVAAPKPPRKQGQNILSSCAKLELFSTALLLQEHFQLPRSALVLHKLQLGRCPRWRQRRSALRKPVLIQFNKSSGRWLRGCAAGWHAKTAHVCHGTDRSKPQCNFIEPVIRRSCSIRGRSRSAMRSKCLYKVGVIERDFWPDRPRLCGNSVP